MNNEWWRINSSQYIHVSSENIANFNEQSIVTIYHIQISIVYYCLNKEVYFTVLNPTDLTCNN